MKKLVVLIGILLSSFSLGGCLDTGDESLVLNQNKKFESKIFGYEKDLVVSFDYPSYLEVKEDSVGLKIQDASSQEGVKLYLTMFEGKLNENFDKVWDEDLVSLTGTYGPLDKGDFDTYFGNVADFLHKKESLPSGIKGFHKGQKVSEPKPRTANLKFEENPKDVYFKEIKGNTLMLVVWNELDPGRFLSVLKSANFVKKELKDWNEGFVNGVSFNYPKEVGKLSVGKLDEEKRYKNIEGAFIKGSAYFPSKEPNQFKDLMFYKPLNSLFYVKEGTLFVADGVMKKITKLFKTSVKENKLRLIGFTPSNYYLYLTEEKEGRCFLHFVNAEDGTRLYPAEMFEVPKENKDCGLIYDIKWSSDRKVVAINIGSLEKNYPLYVSNPGSVKKIEKVRENVGGIKFEEPRVLHFYDTATYVKKEIEAPFYATHKYKLFKLNILDKQVSEIGEEEDKGGANVTKYHFWGQ